MGEKLLLTKGGKMGNGDEIRDNEEQHSEESSGHPSSCQCDSQSTETGSPIKGGIMNRKNMVHIHHGKAICFTKRQKQIPDVTSGY
ncbi:hypothetical protein Y1Q_0021535 [Alligator mississippiensis]|uniref:Uncharacterized protein n=1 Tax=Alligator mississippiensis TaxID=8496 RepID=A0A151PAZ1_ALLMI|nr:hypothetical protein Y1Q_0021535 [Alligator mississippiensis]